MLSYTEEASFYSRIQLRKIIIILSDKKYQVIADSNSNKIYIIADRYGDEYQAIKDSYSDEY